MKRRLIGLMLLCLMGILAMGCSKEKNTAEEQWQEVLENAQEVMDSVSSIFEASANVGEMASHLDDIKAMENVEDAWVEDMSIAVKIQDGGIIKWCFFPHDTLSQEGEAFLESLDYFKAKSGNLPAVRSACISVTTPYDNYRLRKPDADLINTIANALEENDYDVHWALGNEVTPGFIYNQIPQYGVNILITHGDCDNKGKHWIMTGVELENVTMIENIENWMTKSEWVSDRIQIWHMMEERNAEIVYPVYLAVSEDCISEKMHQQFPRNSLMFAWVCRTLKGNPENFWKILENKGLGCYFGYDDSVTTPRAHNDLSSIMNRMINDGITAQKAYSQTGAGSNPQLLLHPSNSNIVLVECDCNIIDTSDWVDLGLPSGLLWATRNVGASSPTDYGNYYAWGETSPKSTYTKENYKYAQYDSSEYRYIPTKYSWTDNIRILQTIDDAATANYGGRMPSKEEWEELINNTTTNKVTINNVNGWCCTGPNGNSLFLPAAGASVNGSSSRNHFSYWANSIYRSDNVHEDWFNANFCSDVYGYLLMGTYTLSTWNRHYGRAVRAVR